MRADPESFLFRFSLLKLLQQTGKVERRARAGRKISASFRANLQREPNNAEARKKFVESLWVTGDRSGAIAEMREASQLFANDPGFFSTLGHMLLACENVPARSPPTGKRFRSIRSMN